MATAMMTATTYALGINCQGSGLCSGNKGALGQAQAQLRGMDQDQTVGDGEKAVCVQSSVSISDPSLCIFYQKTGRQFTIAQTVEFVQNLIDHGCEACGSVPVDPGNNVNNGELTAIMVTSARRGMDNVAVTAAKRDDKIIANGRVKRAGAPAKLLERALGINCRGSSTCGVGGLAQSPAGTLQQVRDAVAAGPDAVFSEGQQLGCVPHVTGRLCAFYQKIGSRTFNRDQSVASLDGLLGHGCGKCGSIPTDDGNNTDNGELTVNFVG